jgi:glycosyltransferase involved in cell wall biosynthesis
MIDNLRLNDQVTIHSPTSLVYEEIYNSAFCALTASKEPFGMVYIESFSMSKPVVSFDIGYGPKEFLVDGYNSLISPCFDTHDFAKKMEMLMTDENLLQKLGDNARQTYINNYEISKVMDKFLRECK